MQTGDTARQKPISVSKKKEKLKSSDSKKFIPENNQSCTLSPRMGPVWLSVRCQASPSAGNQVSWRSGVCLDIYSGMATGLESSKCLSSQTS